MTTIDQIIAQKIGELMIGEWPIGNFLLCVIAILLSVLLCGAIGIERERKGRNAGLRTHLLVGVGSCLVMIISIYGFPQTSDETFKRDVARLAAAVVTGVGFLGAGAIIHRSNGIKGLTTAATIWIVMAIGLACGSMNFVLATGTTLIILAVLILFKKAETKFVKRAPYVKVLASSKGPVVTRIIEAAYSVDCNPQRLEVDIIDDNNVVVAFHAVASGPSFDVGALIKRLEQESDVLNVEVSQHLNQK